MFQYDYVLNDPEIDLDKLKAEIRALIPALKEIYKGNARITCMFKRALNDSEMITVEGTITGHKPKFFTWTEGEKTMKRIVRVAEDVDVITAERIRKLAGGRDPHQAQIKMLTSALFGLMTDIDSATSLANLKTANSTRLQKYQSFISKRQSIIQEGNDFKASM